MRLRVVGVVALVVGLLTGPGWLHDGWGQEKIRRVGILTIEQVASHRKSFNLFYRALQGQGWIEGKNVEFVYVSTYGDASHYAHGAAELVAGKVDVIFAESAAAIRASHEATRTIPIVGEDYTSDPVARGYARSYGRPGGNVTGVFLDAPEFSGKWLELLRAMVPGLVRAVVLWDPSPGDEHLRALQANARADGLELQIVQIRKPEDIDAVAPDFRGPPQAIIILPSPMTYLERTRLAELATTKRLPSTSIFSEFPTAGGLIAYGPDGGSVDERAGVLVAKILSGAKPGDLPIEQPAKFRLVVNLKTASVLGITVPNSILLRADEVIQ